MTQQLTRLVARRRMMVEMADDGPAFVAYNGCSTEYDVVIVVLFIYNSIQIYFYITIGEKYL
jgi:hypothetical protein